MPLHDHSQRIADQESIYAGPVEKPGHRIIVGGQHRQADAADLGGQEVGNRDALPFYAGTGH